MAKRSWRRDYTREAIDAKQRFDELAEHIKEPPDGQIPLGDSGIYTSPNLQHNEPVSPFNCEEYPDSPYCGGNPWSRTPVGLEPEWGLDECGAWVQITPILGFTKLPPVSVGYRRPGECREEKKPPQPPPPPNDNSRPVSPLKLPKTIDPNVNVLIVLINNYFYRYAATWGNKDSWGQELPASFTIDTASTNLVNTTYPAINKNYFSYFPDQNGVSTQVPTIGGAEVQTATSRISQGLDYDRSVYPPRPITYVDSSSFSFIHRAWITVDQAFPQVSNWKRYLDRGTALNSLKGKYLIINFHQGDFVGLDKSVLIWGKLSEVAKDWEGYVVDNQSYSGPAMFGGVLSGGYTANVYKEEWSVAYISQPDSNKYPPPPDQKRKRDCCMQCCTNNQKSNKQDQDLSEIKKMLKEIKKRLGTDEYPVKMPASLNADYNDSGQKTEPGTVTEENLTGVLGRFIRYFDGVMGEWGVGFKVADADPTKEGDQPKFIHAPNVAELMSEMYSHTFDMWLMQYQFLQLDQRHAIESMLARKVGIQNYYLLECLIDWAGFKTKDVAKKIPFLFDIDAEGFEAFLKNKEQEIQIRDFNPDDEGADSFPDSLMRINRAAAIIEAVHSRKFKKDDDIPAKIMEMLKSSAKGVDRVNSDELKKPGTQEDFDQWLRDAEVAFINKVGQGDINNPYGVPYAQRPRLTKIQDSLTGGADDGD